MSRQNYTKTCFVDKMRVGEMKIYPNDCFLIVSNSSKIETLCHMTQVLFKLRFRAMERLTSH